MKNKVTLLLIVFAGVIGFLLFANKKEKINTQDASIRLYSPPIINEVLDFAKSKVHKKEPEKVSNINNKDISLNEIEAEIKKIEDEINSNDFIAKSNKNELSREEANHFRSLLAKRDQAFAVKVKILLEEL